MTLHLAVALSLTTMLSTPGSEGFDPTFLRDSAETRMYTLGRPSNPRPLPDGRTVLFLRSPPREASLRLYSFDVTTGEAKELLTPEGLLAGAEEVLSAAEKARRERMRVTVKGFTSFQVSEDGATVLVPLAGKLYAFERGTGKTRVLYGGAEPILDPRLSPDGKRIAYVKANDVFVAEVASGKEHRVTTGGTEEKPHGLAEFVAQEEMDRMEGYWWSPDGGSLAYAEVDQHGMERLTIADPAKPEHAPDGFFYPRPGKANAKVRLGIIPVAGGRTTWVKWDDAKYPYVARVTWKEKAAPLTLLVQTRDQREEAVLTVDAKTGATKVLHVEKDEAWLNLDIGLPKWLPGGKGFLFASERTGKKALELHRPDGAFEREIVPGALSFMKLLHVGDDGEVFALCAAPDFGTRVVRTSLSGGEPTVVTKEVAEHLPVFAEHGELWLDTVTRADALPETVVMKRDGTKVGTLPSVAETPKFRAVAELVSVEGAERGGTRLDYRAAILRPRGFKKGTKYPVILSVYGGPHHNVVVADERQFLMNQWFADHGFVVVSVDNRGTPRRDRAWERAVREKLGDVPLDDQVDALQALGKKFPELDLARVGIYGWSFGGYLTSLAVLKRPDVFKVGVAGAPVVDWLDYDTHYTERYLGVPPETSKAYSEASLLTYAAKLERPLLVIHGTADDNVYFFHALKLGDAVFKAGKSMELLPLVGFTHLVNEPLVRERLYGRIADYLMTHLK